MNDFFGRHTLVPDLIDAVHSTHPHLVDGTILEHTKGKLPPFVLLFGDRRRVLEAAKRLDRMTHLTALMQQHSLNIGRVEIAVGLFQGTPITLMESQMGGPATEINLREVLSSDCMTTDFKLSEGVHFTTDTKYVIRVGSCAGLNLTTRSSESASKAGFIENFDLIITSHQIGLTGADVQSLSGKLSFGSASVGAAEEVMTGQLGYGRTADKAYLRMDLPERVTGALDKACEQLQHRHHRMGNISKDSLYAESHEADFIHFRQAYDIGSSEMEFSTVVRLCRQKTCAGDATAPGMICAVLGLIPGGNFEKDSPLKKTAEVHALMAGMRALHLLAQSGSTDVPVDAAAGAVDLAQAPKRLRTAPADE